MNRRGFFGAAGIGAVAVVGKACSGVQGTVPSPILIASVDAVLAAAVAGVPAARQAISASTMSANAKRDADEALTVVSDSLGLARTAWTAYVTAPTAAHQCQVSHYVDAAVVGLVDVVHLVQDAGVSVPPSVAAAASALAVVADMLFPGCQHGSPSSAPPSSSTPAHAARRASLAERMHASSVTQFVAHELSGGDRP